MCTEISRGTLSFEGIKEGEKFSIFRIGDTLYFNAGLREHELEWFINGKDGEYGLYYFNLGQVKQEIMVNSEEEKYHLAYLFSHWGFKVRLGKTFHPHPYKQRRRFFTIDDVKDRDPSTGHNILDPRYNTFDLILNRKDTEKFLGCIERLSREYGYKTIYDDFTITRRFLSSVKYNMKYLIK